MGRKSITALKGHNECPFLDILAIVIENKRKMYVSKFHSRTSQLSIVLKNGIMEKCDPFGSHAFEYN